MLSSFLLIKENPNCITFNRGLAGAFFHKVFKWVINRKNMRKILTGFALFSALNLVGCGRPQPQRGVIIRESFHQIARDNTLLGTIPEPFRYAAIVRFLDGNEKTISEYGLRARIADLRYNVGDTVTVDMQDLMLRLPN